MAGNSINVVLKLDTSDFQRSINRAEKNLQAFGSKLQGIGNTLTQGLTLPILGSGGAAIAVAAKYEKLQTSLSTLLGSTEAGAAAFERLAKFAANTPFELEDVASGAKQLLAFGLNIDQVYDSLGFLGDIAGATGSNLQDLTLIFGQARSIGAAYTQDLRQLAQRGIPVFDLLAEKTGLSGDALRKFIEQGKVSFPLLQELLKSTAKEGGIFFGGMEAQSKTLSGAFSTFKDNIQLALAKIGNAIADAIDLRAVMARLSETVQRVSDGFSNLNPGIQKAIVFLGLALAAIGPLLIALGGISKIAAVAVTGLKGLLSVLNAVKVAVAFLVSPVGITVLAVVALTGAVAALYDRLEIVRRVINAVGNTLKELGKLAFDVAGNIAAGFKGLFKGDFSGALDSFKTAFSKSSVINIAQTAAEGFAEGFKDTTNYLRPQLDKIKKDIQALTGAGGGNTNPLADPTPPGPGDTTQKKRPVFELAEIGGGGIFQKTIELNREETDKLNIALQNSSLYLQANRENTIELASAFAEAKAAADEFIPTLQGFEPPGQFLQLMGDAATAAADSFAQAAVQGEASFKRLGAAALSAARQIIGAYIKEGITGLVKNILSGPTGKALGPFALAVAAAAGGAASALFNTLINKVSPPKLAGGGLAYGPTAAIVGDNRNARVDPEVISPLSKLKTLIGDTGNGYLAEARISGDDLLFLVSRAETRQNRIR